MSARRAARIDDNQPAIVAELRAHGYSVAVTSAMGDGFPDIVVGFKDRRGLPANLLVEIKDGTKPPSKRKLTDDERAFFDAWRGRAIVAHTAQDVVDEIVSR